MSKDPKEKYGPLLKDPKEKIITDSLGTAKHALRSQKRKVADKEHKKP